MGHCTVLGLYGQTGMGNLCPVRLSAVDSVSCALSTVESLCPLGVSAEEGRSSSLHTCNH